MQCILHFIETDLLRILTEPYEQEHARSTGTLLSRRKRSRVVDHLRIYQKGYETGTESAPTYSAAEYGRTQSGFAERASLAHFTHARIPDTYTKFLK